MNIGDIEYTRHVFVQTDTAQESDNTPVSFAMGIKVRPLLTRIDAYLTTASAVTNGSALFLENGQGLAENLTMGALLQDARALPLHHIDTALATNGMGLTGPFESTWWKILLPDVQLIGVDTVLNGATWVAIMHYRFATLTDDEIIEIAAQRAQS